MCRDSDGARWLNGTRPCPECGLGPCLYEPAEQDAIPYAANGPMPSAPPLSATFWLGKDG